MNTEQWLSALATDDARTEVPRHVDAAVMEAWDSTYGHLPRLSRPRRPWRAAMVWAVAGAFVAAFVAISAIVVTRRLNQPARIGRSDMPQESASMAAQVDAARRLSRRPPSEPALSSGRTGPVLPSNAPTPNSYVLVPDIDGVGPPLSLMRVRMSRSAFSRLGIPIANPDGDGMIDVEVLVGQDGVARSIRGAAVVESMDLHP